MIERIIATVLFVIGGVVCYGAKKIAELIFKDKATDDKIINILNIQKKALNDTPTTVSFDDLKKQIEDLKKYIVILANPIEKEIIDNDIKTILKKLESLKKISNKIFNDTIKKILP